MWWIVILAVTALVASVVIYLRVAGHGSFPWIQFYAKGKESGFSFREIGLLRRVAIETRLDNPTALFWSIKQLTRSSREIIVKMRAKDVLDDAQSHQLLGKLFELRRRVEFDLPRYRLGLKNTREIVPRQRLKVALPERPDILLYLVVIRGLAPHPIWLLTNVAPSGEKNHAEWVAEIYLTRWKCEETYRFIKQSYHLEDVRVRSYNALRSTYALVHAVLYFVTVVVGQKAKLNLIFKKVCEKAKRVYALSTFFQYAVADGIYRLLFGSKHGPKEPLPTPSTGQRTLEFLRPLY